MGKFYYVYVLQSERDHNLYVGYTSDIRKRLEEHNNGKVPNDILDSYLVLVSPSPHDRQRPYKDFDRMLNLRARGERGVFSSQN